jgi:Flp pilus assembly protein TadG
MFRYEVLSMSYLSKLRAYATNATGNVTVTFALATIPMVGFVGAAVDYSHANAVKAEMQAAADSTALMLSKEAASISATALTTKANDYFKALHTRSDSTNLLVNATYVSSGGSKVVVNASTKVKTNFMGLMGFSQLNVAVDSQVKWGNTRLRVALALDVTGSMDDDGKIEALKTATKSLLDQLKAAAIIPFNKDVNVGKSNYTQSWVKWDEWDDNNGSCDDDGWGESKSKEVQNKGREMEGGRPKHLERMHYRSRSRL